VVSVERLSPGDLPVLVAVVYPRRWHEMALLLKDKLLVATPLEYSAVMKHRCYAWLIFG
jgi:hypothetical protein